MAATPAEADAYAGYLQKKGHGSSFFGRRNWSRRFFRLVGNVLRYSNEPGGKAKGDIPLERATVVVSVHPKYPAYFEIHTASSTGDEAGRVYPLTAPDDAALVEWLQRLGQQVTTGAIHTLYMDLDGMSIPAQQLLQEAITRAAEEAAAAAEAADGDAAETEGGEVQAPAGDESAAGVGIAITPPSPEASGGATTPAPTPASPAGSVEADTVPAPGSRASSAGRRGEADDEDDPAGGVASASSGAKSRAAAVRERWTRRADVSSGKMDEVDLPDVQELQSAASFASQAKSLFSSSTASMHSTAAALQSPVSTLRSTSSSSASPGDSPPPVAAIPEELSDDENTDSDAPTVSMRSKRSRFSMSRRDELLASAPPVSAELGSLPAVHESLHEDAVSPPLESPFRSAGPSPDMLSSHATPPAHTPPVASTTRAPPLQMLRSESEVALDGDIDFDLEVTLTPEQSHTTSPESDPTQERAQGPFAATLMETAQPAGGVGDDSGSVVVHDAHSDVGSVHGRDDDDHVGFSRDDDQLETSFSTSRGVGADPEQMATPAPAEIHTAEAPILSSSERAEDTAGIITIHSSAVLVVADAPIDMMHSPIAQRASAQQPGPLPLTQPPVVSPVLQQSVANDARDALAAAVLADADSAEDEDDDDTFGYVQAVIATSRGGRASSVVSLPQPRSAEATHVVPVDLAPQAVAPPEATMPVIQVAADDVEAAMSMPIVRHDAETPVRSSGLPAPTSSAIQHAAVSRLHIISAEVLQPDDVRTTETVRGVIVRVATPSASESARSDASAQSPDAPHVNVQTVEACVVSAAVMLPIDMPLSVQPETVHNTAASTIVQGASLADQYRVSNETGLLDHPIVNQTAAPTPSHHTSTPTYVTQTRMQLPITGSDDVFAGSPATSASRDAEVEARMAAMQAQLEEYKRLTEQLMATVHVLSSSSQPQPALATPPQAVSVPWTPVESAESTVRGGMNSSTGYDDALQSINRTSAANADLGKTSETPRSPPSPVATAQVHTPEAAQTNVAAPAGMAAEMASGLDVSGQWLMSPTPAKPTRVVEHAHSHDFPGDEDASALAASQLDVIDDAEAQAREAESEHIDVDDAIEHDEYASQIMKWLQDFNTQHHGVLGAVHTRAAPASPTELRSLEVPASRPMPTAYTHAASPSLRAPSLAWMIEDLSRCVSELERNAAARRSYDAAPSAPGLLRPGLQFSNVSPVQVPPRVQSRSPVSTVPAPLMRAHGPSSASVRSTSRGTRRTSDRAASSIRAGRTAAEINSYVTVRFGSRDDAASAARASSRGHRVRLLDAVAALQHHADVIGGAASGAQAAPRWGPVADMRRATAPMRGSSDGAARTGSRQRK